MNQESKFTDVIKKARESRDYADTLNRALYGMTFEEVIKTISNKEEKRGEEIRNAKSKSVD